MAWAIDYTETARKQLRKLDRQNARRILDFMDERIALLDDPRSSGKALTGSALGPVNTIYNCLPESVFAQRKE